MKRLLQNCYHFDNPRKMRKRDLKPLKEYYKLDCNKKQDIWESIKEICKPSERCENDSDPITLHKIDEIPNSRLFEWEQDGKRFAADIISLKQLFDNQQYINPWAIDYATGFFQAENSEKYKKRFDMRKCRGLIKKVMNEYEKLFLEENQENEIELPEITKLRFKIQKFGELIKNSAEDPENRNGQDVYAVTSMNFIETLKNDKCMCLLRDVCIICLNQMIISNPYSISCNIFEQLCFSYQLKYEFFMNNENNDPVSNLKCFVNLLNNIDNLCTEDEKLEILRLVFFTLDDLINQT